MKKSLYSNMRKGALLLAVNSACAMAQTTGQAVPPDPAGEIGVVMTVAFLIFVVATLMYIIGVMNADVDPIVEFLVRVKNYIFPQATEAVADTGHNFDGITELDNRIPPWFNYLFLGTVLFGVVYLLDYHVLKVSPLSAQEYQAELSTAAMERQIMLANEPLLDETKLVALKDSLSVAAGRENFQKYCISCHGPEGGGIVGPNLTDRYWIHGGGVTNVYTTIKNGVPAKGMISWGLVFTQRQMLQLASFVLSMQGTNPVGAKPPQGDLYIEPVAQSAPSDTLAKR